MKKIISFIFAAVLAISSVFISVGCGGKKDDPNANVTIDPKDKADDDDATRKKAENAAKKHGGVGFDDPVAPPPNNPKPTPKSDGK